MRTGSITHIKAKAKRKTNPAVSDVILVARKQKAWHAVAHRLSSSSRKQISLNLSELDKHTKAGDTVAVVGKILGSGTLTKKIRVAALHISHSAKAKLAESKSEYVSLHEEITKNPKATGVKII